MSDSGWAKRIARDFRAAVAQREHRDAIFVAQQNIRRAFTEELWTRLRAAFNDRCTALNAEIGRHILTIEPKSPWAFSLRRNEPQHKRIAVGCDPDTYELRISTTVRKPGDLMTLTVEIDRESGQGYLADQGKARREPEEVAESVLETLLKMDL